jgi:hypothetical protein
LKPEIKNTVLFAGLQPCLLQHIGRQSASVTKSWFTERKLFPALVYCNS